MRSGPDTWGPADRPATTLNNDGIPKALVDDIITIPFNNVEATLAIPEENAEDLAGVIIDPLPGRLAYAAADHDYLTMLRNLRPEPDRY